MDNSALSTHFHGLPLMASDHSTDDEYTDDQQDLIRDLDSNLIPQPLAPNAILPLKVSDDPTKDGHTVRNRAVNRVIQRPIRQPLPPPPPGFSSGAAAASTALVRLTAALPIPGRSPMTKIQVFHRVLEDYQTVIFTPIAKMIGLTPEAALRMALNMGIGEIQRMANNTPRPFYGYLAADAIPSAASRDNTAAPPWSVREIICLAAIYTELDHTERNMAIKDKIDIIQNRHICERGYQSLVVHVREVLESPWITHTDYRRLAHQYQQRRVEASRAVARGLGLTEEYGRLVEEVLFTRESLLLFGYNAHSSHDVWKPRHITKERQIQNLMKAITIYQKPTNKFTTLKLQK